MNTIDPRYIAAALAAQAIGCTARRAERIAHALAPELAALAGDLAALPFDVEAPMFSRVLAELAPA